MIRMTLLLLLAVALYGSLPAQNTEETAWLLAPFNSHPRADIAIELVKKYEGLRDRSDFPYYSYEHKRLPKGRLSYDMTGTKAETLLRKDLAVRYKLLRKYKKDTSLLTALSYNVGQGVLLGYGGHPKNRLIRKLEAGDRNIYRGYIAHCRYKGKTVHSIERQRKMESLLLYE